MTTSILIHSLIRSEKKTRYSACGCRSKNPSRGPLHDSWLFGTDATATGD
ncbi:hypothetical protein JOH51_004431 [Rhizobium leguminosarum]|nr:hypothetical protein [Rhizobium leguminosarum]